MRSRLLAVLALAFGFVSPAFAGLAAPTNLAAAAASSTSIKLTWVDNNGSPDETGFSVERSLSATSGFAAVATTAADATSYVDTGLVTGQLYYYRVRAVRGNQSTNYTNVASAKPADLTAPSVPNPVADSVVSCSQINVAWGASTDTGGSGLAGYRVYRNNVMVTQVPASANLLNDAGLAASTTYSYQVTAIDNAGNQSSMSMTASANTGSCPTTTTVAPTTTSTSTSRPSTTSTSTTRPSTTSTSSPTTTSRPSTTSTSTSSSTTTSRPTTTSTTSAIPTTTSTTLVSTGSFVWDGQMGGTALSDSVVPYAVTVDRNGNSYVTGVMYGNVNFGTGVLTSAGRADMFVAKYSPAGVPQWVKRFGDAADQFGEGIAVDTSGNVYVTGYFFGTVDFGTGPLTSNGYDIVVAKYTTNGVGVWAKVLGGSSSDMGQAIAVDGSGNVYVAGQFAATVDFGGGPLTSAGGFDGFLAKYTTNGAFVWAKRVGGTSVDNVTGVGVDASGNPTIVGYYQGTANFGGADLPSAGSADIFVAHYTSAGVHQWSAHYGDADDQRAYAVAVDGPGNVVVTGYFAGQVDFGGGPMVNVGGADIFLVKLGPTGAYAWSKSFGNTGTYGSVGEGVAIDPSGNVLLTGEVEDPVDFGGGLFVPSVLTYDAFVAKFSTSGAYLWANRYVSAWDDHGDAIASDPNGNPIAVGDFYDSENFGGGLLMSPGGTDGYILKLTP